ncbi:TolC family protein [Tenacibaculum tangerinum]|uniref:TolC family protein n=1 Tax=Tenacibaculum tangerinum TaxID=3038772 RepID=A0ABY8L1P7_9FLAO|nr:TolC family protein [Tenacibaculum tangerinum]WGH74113.1 TolC family protein [Tenacibaculum tangerinum]
MKSQLKYFILIIFYLSTISMFCQKKWTLESCIEHAKQHNIDVIKQKIQTEVLNSDIKIAKGNYLPDANFNASQNFSLGNSFNVSTGVGQRESSSNSFSLSSSLNIFNGFKNRHTLQKSKLSKEKSEADVDRIEFDLTLNITNKYLQILFNKELLKVAEEQVKISNQNYNRLKRLYDNALIGKRELLEIESTLASDTKEKEVMKNKVKNSLIELRELLDIKQIESFDIEEITIDNLLSVPNKITKNIIENNPQIIFSKLAIELQSKEIQLSKVNFYPRVNLNYSYGSNYFHILGQEDVVFNQETGQNEANGFWVQLNNNRTHFIGISASIPIFNRFLTKENYKKTQEELKTLEAELENNRQILRNKIEIATNDMETAKVSLDASKIATDTQNKAFEILQKQYKNGNVGIYEFLEGKSKYIRNASEYIKSKYEYYFKSKVLGYYFNQ